MAKLFGQSPATFWNALFNRMWLVWYFCWALAKMTVFLFADATLWHTDNRQAAKLWQKNKNERRCIYLAARPSLLFSVLLLLPVSEGIDCSVHRFWQQDPSLPASISIEVIFRTKPILCRFTRSPPGWKEQGLFASFTGFPPMGEKRMDTTTIKYMGNKANSSTNDDESPSSKRCFAGL